MSKLVKILLGVFIFIIVAVVGAYFTLCFLFQSQVKDMAQSQIKAKMPLAEIQLNAFEPQNLSFVYPKATIPEGAITIRFKDKTEVKLPAASLEFDLLSLSTKMQWEQFSANGKVFEKVALTVPYFADSKTVTIDSITPVAATASSEMFFKKVLIEWTDPKEGSQVYSKYKLQAAQIESKQGGKTLIDIKNAHLLADLPFKGGAREGAFDVSCEALQLQTQKGGFQFESQPMQIKSQVQFKDITEDQWANLLAQFKSASNSPDGSSKAIVAFYQLWIDSELVVKNLDWTWQGAQTTADGDVKMQFKPFHMTALTKLFPKGFRLEQTLKWDGIHIDAKNGTVEFGVLQGTGSSETKMQTYQEFMKQQLGVVIKNVDSASALNSFVGSMLYPQDFKMDSKMTWAGLDVKAKDKADFKMDQVTLGMSFANQLLKYSFDSEFGFELKDQVKLKMEKGKLHFDLEQKLNSNPLRDYLLAQSDVDPNKIPLNVYGELLSQPSTVKANWNTNMGTLGFELNFDFQSELVPTQIINPNGATTFAEMNDEVGKQNLLNVINNIKGNLTAKLLNVEAFKKTLDTVKPGASMMVMVALPYVQPSADQQNWTSVLALNQSTVTLNGQVQPKLQGMVDDIIEPLKPAPVEEPVQEN